MLIALPACSGLAVFKLAHGGAGFFGSVTSGSFLNNALIYSVVVLSATCMLGLCDRDIRGAINPVSLRVLIDFISGAVSPFLLFTVIPNNGLASSSVVVAPSHLSSISVLFKKLEFLIGRADRTIAPRLGSHRVLDGSSTVSANDSVL